jgi:hypothetical protein
MIDSSCRPRACLRPPQLLTADQGGTLCVWSLHCGRLRLRLTHVHGEQRISAMCLDANCRRLFTASEGGPIKVGAGPLAGGARRAPRSGWHRPCCCQAQRVLAATRWCRHPAMRCR